jgi:ATP-dependent DNA helicase RecG
VDLSEKKGTGIPKILRELRQNGSPTPEFDMDEDRTYLNTIIRIREGFEIKNKMSESMSKLERTRMRVILQYLNANKNINSTIAAGLLGVEVKTASRLLSKAEKLNILKGKGKTRNKVYFKYEEE